jgi:hypothetical protein
MGTLGSGDDGVIGQAMTAIFQKRNEILSNDPKQIVDSYKIYQKFVQLNPF